MVAKTAAPTWGSEQESDDIATLNWALEVLQTIVAPMFEKVTFPEKKPNT